MKLLEEPQESEFQKLKTIWEILRDLRNRGLSRDPLYEYWSLAFEQLKQAVVIDCSNNN